jgi:hypothetical protein
MFLEDQMNNQSDKCLENQMNNQSQTNVFENYQQQINKY